MNLLRSDNIFECKKALTNHIKFRINTVQRGKSLQRKNTAVLKVVITALNPNKEVESFSRHKLCYVHVPHNFILDFEE